MSSISSSSISSLSSLSSQSSSTEHYLNPPFNLTFNTNISASTITINWDWNNSGHYVVTPTGFIIERKINSDAWEVLSFSILPSARSYSDILSEANATRIFAEGLSLSYRIKAYYVGGI